MNLTPRIRNERTLTRAIVRVERLLAAKPNYDPAHVRGYQLAVRIESKLLARYAFALHPELREATHTIATDEELAAEQDALSVEDLDTLNQLDPRFAAFALSCEMSSACDRDTFEQRVRRIHSMLRADNARVDSWESVPGTTDENPLRN